MQAFTWKFWTATKELTITLLQCVHIVSLSPLGRRIYS